VQALGCERTVCIGNGHNDRLILATAALGIAVVESEGTAQGSLAAANIVCRSILDALDLLVYPMRIVATLRS
jgi:soluble P-type ATPase